MKTFRPNHCIILFLMCLFFFPDISTAQPDKLAKPSDIQYKWHEQERIMFVCLDPCTWQGREYDNHSTPLSRINPNLLNTDQWCEVAKSWGAKEILFVAKHTGGFCWWHTQTTESGKLYYPAWNTLKSSALKTGISTQYDDDPDGDAWAPLEADVTLYNHNWFWSPLNEKKRREVDELMDTKNFTNGTGEQTIDLSPHIMRPGHYEVTFTAAIANGGVKVTKAEIYFDGDMLTQQDFIRQKEKSNTFYINRTAQVAQGSSSVLKVTMSSNNAVFQNKGEIKIRERARK